MRISGESKNEISNIDLDEIKAYITKLYDLKEIVHITINDGRLKLDNKESLITGVYPRFFSVKSQVKNYYEQFTIKYIDVLIGKFVIEELNKE